MPSRDLFNHLNITIYLIKMTYFKGYLNYKKGNSSQPEIRNATRYRTTSSSENDNILTTLNEIETVINRIELVEFIPRSEEDGRDGRGVIERRETRVELEAVEIVQIDWRQV